MLKATKSKVGLFYTVLMASMELQISIIILAHQIALEILLLF